MFSLAEINWVGVLVATIAAMILGTIWYGPLFGKPWMELVGLTKKDGQKDMGKIMAIGILNSALIVIVLSLVLTIVAPTTLSEAFCITGLVWLGFTATNEANHAIWARGPWKLFLINSSHSLVNLLIAAWILMSLS